MEDEDAKGLDNRIFQVLCFAANLSTAKGESAHQSHLKHFRDTLGSIESSDAVFICSRQDYNACLGAYISV